MYTKCRRAGKRQKKFHSNVLRSRWDDFYAFQSITPSSTSTHPPPNQHLQPLKWFGNEFAEFNTHKSERRIIFIIRTGECENVFFHSFFFFLRQSVFQYKSITQNGKNEIKKFSSFQKVFLYYLYIIFYFIKSKSRLDEYNVSYTNRAKK